VSAAAESMRAKSADGLPAYAMLSVIATAGFFYVNIMAAIVDGLVTGLGFTNAQAGFVGSANIYGASAGSLIAVLIVRRVRWRPTLATLFVCLILADVASTAVHAPSWLIALRAVHGLIGGMAVGVTYSLMARTAAPDRAFGMLLFVQYTLGGLGVMYLPKLVPEYGTGVLFMAMAALTMVALTFTLMLHDVSRHRNGALQNTRPTRESRLIVILTLAAMFLFQCGNMALAAFILRVGEVAGLARDFASTSLGWATWIGSLGAVAVMVLGTRHGRARPLLTGILASAICSAAFFWAGNALVYFAANVGSGIAWAFVVPYVFGMAAQLDTSGQLTTLAGLVSKLGLASGPLAAGLIAAGNDFTVLIAAATCTVLLCAAVALPAARRLDTGRASGGAG